MSITDRFAAAVVAVLFFAVVGGMTWAVHATPAAVSTSCSAGPAGLP